MAAPALAMLAVKMRGNLLHEAMHLLDNERMRLVAHVEIEDHLFDPGLLHFLEGLDDLLRTPEQDGPVGEVFLLHIAKRLGDLDEVLQGRRRIFRTVWDRADDAVVEIVELRLPAV